MASRREQKERLRAERLAAEQNKASSSQRRLMLGYVLAGILTLVVVAGLASIVLKGGGSDTTPAGDVCAEAHVQGLSGDVEGVKPDCRQGADVAAIAKIGKLEDAVAAAGCDLKQNLPDEGNSHVAADKTVHYKTVPPTSGDHDPNPQADGAYSETPEPRHYVHSMEHGRIEIHYDPKLPDDEQLQLKGVFDRAPDGMLIFPDPDMPYAVAVTAWTNLVGCKKFSPAVLDVIRDFRDAHLGLGPETGVPINL